MYSTFQSHEPEFDYLKSLEIEEKINKIRFECDINNNRTKSEDTHFQMVEEEEPSTLPSLYK